MFTAGADAVEQANAEFKAGIKNELKAAMKGGDKAATAVLKSLLSDLTYAEKSPQDKGVSAVTILRRSIKRRQESAASFRAGARDDLAVAEEAEAAILERFLPKQMSEDEIAAVVAQVRDRIGAKGAGDLGKVMKVLNAEIDASVAPRKLVSEVAKRVLSA
ncbi:hypothetical protein HK105_209216 [Polyrhizophydium stewartii]|uniref:Altered inheritance of mitochondria protein 41 n=1 Tax=Polyrhizophydium stewartii TaxID=2732419 RepID=A0ABR4MVN3_9FUNG